MNQTQFIFLYLSLFTIEFIILITLTILNINSILKNRKTIPQEVTSIINLEQYGKSINYSIRKEHFSILHLVLSSLTTLLILFSGTLGTIESIILSITANKILVGLSFVAVISILLYIVNLPLTLYSTFVIEEEFGFNKMTLKSFVSDSVKEGLLGIIIGSIVLTVLFIFMEKTGDSWWIWTTVFFIIFQLLLTIIYPIFIAPIFNKFSPLEDGELKDGVNKLSQKAKFNIKGIFIMDGSKRSNHSNAYFTGFGKSKRVVLYDTLVDKLSIEQLLAVLAHEFGHWKKGHIKKRIALSFVTLPAVFFILSLLLHYNPLYSSFGLQAGSYHGLIILISMISGSFTFFISPLSNKFSRKHEFEADNFAIELMEESESLKEALLQLSKENLSNLTPDRLYSAYHYSHPPLLERLKNITN
ncbi:MAG: M48 family metallopeptidase [Spirochaetales bacterium]|nr:M48 family metallopeptidase [Spirochaetales bacterium]